MKFNYTLPFLTAPPRPEFVSGAAIAGLARAAELAGFTSVALSDHPAPSESWRQQEGHDALDPFVGLSFAAAATEHLRMLTYVAIVPYRHPMLLAKTVATLDALSNGRLDLGLGVGYMRREFAAVGATFDGRGRLMDEAIEVMKQAWTGHPVDHNGDGFVVRGVTSQPPPAQRPHPPLWFGGNSRAALRRVARFGDGWLSMPNPRAHAEQLKSAPLETGDDLRSLLGVLDDELEQAGRSARPSISFQIPHGEEAESEAALVERIAGLADAGVTHVSLNGIGDTVAEAVDDIERLATVVAHFAESVG
jgi:probable F420-dependent oxidoreductase